MSATTSVGMLKRMLEEHRESGVEIEYSDLARLLEVMETEYHVFRSIAASNTQLEYLFSYSEHQP